MDFDSMLPASGSFLYVNRCRVPCGGSVCRSCGYLCGCSAAFLGSGRFAVVLRSVAVAFIFALFRAFMLSMGCCPLSSIKALFSPFSALYAVLNFSLYARLRLVVNVHFASLPCVALYLPFLGVLCAFVGFSPSAAFIAVFGSFMRSIVLL